MLGLFKSPRRKIKDLEATLVSDSEREVYGEIEVELFADGDYSLEIELSHVTKPLHHPLTLYIDGRRIGEFTPRSLRTRYLRTSADGPLGFEPARGQRVAVSYQGQKLVSGVFKRD